MNLNEFLNGLTSGAFDDQIKLVYGGDNNNLLKYRARFICAAEKFSRLYPECDEIRVFSAPGRSEIGGNHTDHQHGRVLAAAITLDVIAIVAYNKENTIKICSEGYPDDSIDLDDLEMHEEEKGTSAALIRGIASKLKTLGADIKGFNAYTTSEVLSGSGLSSSAAFEVLIGTIIDQCFNAGKAGAVEIAKIGQYAENVYFGKASGLMDQMVSSVGGFVGIDFAAPGLPDIKEIAFDFSKAGYSLCITDTKGSHADLTDDYSSISKEMKHVAQEMGANFLRDVDEESFYSSLPALRGKCTDREILRAAHFFAENQRAADEAAALSAGDTETFFRLVNESGTSSAELLQNLYSPRRPDNQEIPLAIMLSKRFLGGCGAVRVHGGGFAGTILAFVPAYLAKRYSEEMERVFGQKSCYILSIRPYGGYEFKL